MHPQEASEEVVVLEVAEEEEAVVERADMEEVVVVVAGLGEDGVAHRRFGELRKALGSSSRTWRSMAFGRPLRRLA